MLDILYYPEGERGPVKEFLERLARQRAKAFARLALDLEILGAEGLRSQQVSIRHLGGKLWELRRPYEGIQYRVFFGVWNGAVWLLHAIEKKGARAPDHELELARKRPKEGMAQ